MPTATVPAVPSAAVPDTHLQHLVLAAGRLQRAWQYNELNPGDPNSEASVEHAGDEIRALLAATPLYAGFLYLLTLYDRMLEIHARVGMDTPEDRALHDEAVASFRAGRDKVRTLVPSPTGDNRPGRDEFDFEVERALGAVLLNPTLEWPERDLPDGFVRNVVYVAVSALRPESSANGRPEAQER